MPEASATDIMAAKNFQTAPEIVIRKAQSEQDISTVRRLMREYGDYLADSPSGAASICLAGYEDELARLPHGYLVLLLAEVNGVPAGCVALRKLTHFEHACEMKRLWVGDRFRGLRLGRLLVEEAISWATQRGFEAIYLDTVPAAMPDANRLYASFGFERVQQYNDNPVAGLAYFRKNLTSPGNVR